MLTQRLGSKTPAVRRICNAHGVEMHAAKVIAISNRSVLDHPFVFMLEFGNPKEALVIHDWTKQLRDEDYMHVTRWTPDSIILPNGFKVLFFYEGRTWIIEIKITPRPQWGEGAITFQYQVTLVDDSKDQTDEDRVSGWEPNLTRAFQGALPTMLAKDTPNDQLLERIIGLSNIGEAMRTRWKLLGPNEEESDVEEGVASPPSVTKRQRMMTQM